MADESSNTFTSLETPISAFSEGTINDSLNMFKRYYYLKLLLHYFVSFKIYKIFLIDQSPTNIMVYKIITNLSGGFEREFKATARLHLSLFE